MRYEADEIIFEVWGEVEKAFSELQGEERIKKCVAYGVIYYERKDRNKSKKEND